MSNPLSTLRDNFSPLSNLNFRIYLGGQAVSLIGTWMQITAQGWVVWTLTHSEAASGYVQMLGTLPILVIGLWTGVWADRLDRRRLLIWTQAGAMTLAFVLAYLVTANLVKIEYIYFLALCLGVITALDTPAQQTFLGDLSGMSQIRKAVNLNAMIIQISRILGPAIAGIVLAKLGAGPAFWINGLSFLVVIISLILVRSHQVVKPHSGRNPIAEMGDALRFIRTQPRMQDLFLFAGMMVFFGLSVILSQLPAFADHVLGGDAQTYSTLTSMSGLGALTSVLLVVPLLQARRRSGIMLFFACLWLGVAFLALSFARTEGMAAICLFFASIAPPTVIPTTLGLTQTMTPPEMRGRVMTLFSMVTFGFQPIAMLFVGLMAEHYGVVTVIRVNAILIMIGVTLLIGLRPALRAWEPAKRKPTGETLEVPVAH